MLRQRAKPQKDHKENDARNLSGQKIEHCFLKSFSFLCTRSAYNRNTFKIMITVKIHNVIANEANKWWYCWDETEGVFSLEFVQKLLADNPDEKDFKFDIHCPGGEVAEGLAIYDCLRTSGKNIHMNIEGDCHSMAVTLLLAAPLKNRTANPNCLALIHKVFGCAYSGTADELEKAANETRMLQNKILNIYAERTNKSLEELQEIMNEEKIRTAQDLLDWGFINSINTYNTNYKPNKNIMGKAKNLKQMATDFMNKVNALLNTEEPVNYEHTDADGAVLFTTEAEDDTLEVGMAASPDGTFTLPDGRTVTIADGAITEIAEPEEDPEEETNLEEEVETLRAENASLRDALTEAKNLIDELSKNVRSNFKPNGRTNSAKKAPEPTKEDRKSNIREKIKNAKK